MTITLTRRRALIGPWALAALGLGTGAGLGLIAGPAQAHGPSRQKTQAEITLNADPDTVWAAIGNFGDMSWHPAVTATTAPDQPAIGALRQLTLTNGAVIEEELTKFDAAKRSYSYRMTADNLDALPVNNYSAALTVKDAGGKALVEWRGAFYRGYPNNDPPPELNDEAAMAAVNALYAAGFKALAERFGAAS